MIKKIIIGVAVVTIIIITASWIAVRNWANTPYGKLDTATAVFCKIWGAIEPDFNKMSPQEYRKVMNDHMASTPPPAIEIAQIKDELIKDPSGEIPVRIYTPEKKEKMPVIIFFHGGGWVLGNIDTHNSFAMRLAKSTGSIVVSVDYRLAPEHPFPAATNDAYSALLWTARNAASFGGDPSRMAVAGDSAGGNLSAAVSLMARDKKGPKIKYQILIYAVTNPSDMETGSHKDFATGYFLEKKLLEWFRAHYLPDKKEWQNPFASPFLAGSHKNLPAAIIITAQFDPLRDDGEAYAGKLKKSGVRVSLKRYDGMVHAFMSMDSLVKQSSLAFDYIAEELKAGGF